MTCSSGDAASIELRELMDRVPEVWTAVSFDGRRWGLSRVTRVGGRVITVYAEELAGPGLVSANVYRTAKTEVLKACEMPADIVLSFLRGWREP